MINLFVFFKWKQYLSLFCSLAVLCVHLQTVKTLCDTVSECVLLASQTTWMKKSDDAKSAVPMHSHSNSAITTFTI